ncbi:hypothetical protein M758_9G154700 [Ceratodon purpureus]|nr:hypothetical protein M758_9G154700 [Ceratodon purpureus]
MAERANFTCITYRNASIFWHKCSGIVSFKWRECCGGVHFARNAWQKLGNMSQEEAMQKYIAVLTEINPTWHEDYQKSKEPAKEATQQNQGDLSPSSDKIDASPVLIELVTSGEEDLPKYVSSKAFHTIIFLFARNCCFMTRINVQTILFLAIPSRLDMTFKNFIRSFAIL